MAVKSMSTRMEIVGRSAKCRGGSSAVDKSAYISRTTMYCEYDGKTYYPKYSEDLVHCEVLLPPQAPSEYQDPSVLWNAVEMAEKGTKAQLARTYKVSLPNEWSYELATEVMRDYVQRNFVDEGMCAQFAIHDSENEKTGQRNLHCHIMLTMRPILEDGTWGDKQKKIYILDADGNKIRTKSGNYKCKTQDVTGWNSHENAKRWRKDLADTINSVNSEHGFTRDFWEHRSFAEQGLDLLPQIHLGERASAMERLGIHTERGDINRRIIERNTAVMKAKMLLVEAENQLKKLVESKPAQTVIKATNEVLDVIRAMVKRKGRLKLPVANNTYLKKISNRTVMQEQTQIESFVTKHEIETFEQLAEFKKKREPDFEKLHAKREAIIEEIATLDHWLYLYDEMAVYEEAHKTSKSLKGFAKRNYDKEHDYELKFYDDYRAELKRELADGQKITPKAWRKRKAELEQTLERGRPEMAEIVVDLASVEVIEHNREALEQEIGHSARMLEKAQEQQKRNQESL